MLTNGRTTHWILLVLVLATTACSPELPAPTPTAVPASATPDLGLTATVQKLTAIAGYSPSPTQTPTITKTPYPTITPIPSATIEPSSTPPPTATSLSGTDVTGSPTSATPSDPYGCKVTARSPADWTVFKPGVSFDATWTIENTGLNTWKYGKVVLAFISGNRLQKNKDQNTFNLPGDVAPGDHTAITVDMIAPSKFGLYGPAWGLMLNSSRTVFCHLSVRISVTATGQ